MFGHRILVAAAVLATLSACSTSTKGAGSGARESEHAAVSSAPDSAAPPTGSGPPSTEAAPATDSEASSSAVQPAPTTPVRTATVHADPATYLIKVWTETTDADCTAHAYGDPVISFLHAHPCHSVSRLLATTKIKGKRVGFAQSSIGFAGKSPQAYTTAGKFSALVTRDGTGNISDLMREGRRLPAGPTAVPSPDAFSALSQDASVTIVDAWYLDKPTADNDPALVQMAHDIYLQF